MGSPHAQKYCKNKQHLDANTLRIDFINMEDVQVLFGLDEKPTCPKVV